MADELLTMTAPQNFGITGVTGDNVRAQGAGTLDLAFYQDGRLEGPFAEASPPPQASARVVRASTLPPDAPTAAPVNITWRPWMAAMAAPTAAGHSVMRAHGALGVPSAPPVPINGGSGGVRGTPQPETGQSRAGDGGHHSQRPESSHGTPKGPRVALTVSAAGVPLHYHRRGRITPRCSVISAPAGARDAFALAAPRPERFTTLPWQGWPRRQPSLAMSSAAPLATAAAPSPWVRRAQMLVLRVPTLAYGARGCGRHTRRGSRSTHRLRDHGWHGPRRLCRPTTTPCLHTSPHWSAGWHRCIWPAPRRTGPVALIRRSLVHPTAPVPRSSPCCWRLFRRAGRGSWLCCGRCSFLSRP